VKKKDEKIDKTNKEEKKDKANKTDRNEKKREAFLFTQAKKRESSY